MIDNTIHPLITFTGSGVAGFFMGMFLRRVLKFLVIIIGSFLGAVFLFNGCRRVNISRDRLTGIEWEMILWHGCNHFLLKFPVRIFLGHWEFPQLVGSQLDWWQV
jgi:uncharacterized membrane protein (Fun14 family)